MGRKKIQIKYIEDQTTRRSTFMKRKIGVFKKAIELSKLTGAKLHLKIFDIRDQILHEYVSSGDGDFFKEFANKNLQIASAGEDNVDMPTIILSQAQEEQNDSHKTQETFANSTVNHASNNDWNAQTEKEFKDALKQRVDSLTMSQLMTLAQPLLGSHCHQSQMKMLSQTNCLAGAKHCTLMKGQQNVAGENLLTGAKRQKISEGPTKLNLFRVENTRPLVSAPAYKIEQSPHISQQASRSSLLGKRNRLSEVFDQPKIQIHNMDKQLQVIDLSRRQRQVPTVVKMMRPSLKTLKLKPTHKMVTQAQAVDGSKEIVMNNSWHLKTEKSEFSSLLRGDKSLINGAKDFAIQNSQVFKEENRSSPPVITAMGASNKQCAYNIFGGTNPPMILPVNAMLPSLHTQIPQTHAYKQLGTAAPVHRLTSLVPGPIYQRLNAKALELGPSSHEPRNQEDQIYVQKKKQVLIPILNFNKDVVGTGAKVIMNPVSLNGARLDCHQRRQVHQGAPIVGTKSGGERLIGFNKLNKLNKLNLQDGCKVQKMMFPGKTTMLPRSLVQVIHPFKIPREDPVMHQTGFGDEVIFSVNDNMPQQVNPQ